MASLMISCDLLLFVRDDLALLLRTDPNFNECFFDIFLHDVRTAFFCCVNGSLVEKVLKIRTGKSSRCLGDLMKVHIVSQRFVLGVDHQDFFSALDIRTSHTDFSVKSSRTEDCRIQNIHTVGRCHYDDTLIYPKTIHLYKKLVQCLLSLIMAAAHSGSSLTGYRIDLINKDDTRCMALALFKKISYTGSTDTYEHLHEIRS